tara:strand:- start:581 stop:703 length:123 start_codon:yes stop_codon:yes gene_type:complete
MKKEVSHQTESLSRKWVKKEKKVRETKQRRKNKILAKDYS